MKKLLSLRLTTHVLREEVARYVKSEQFDADIAQACRDDELRARLTLALLEGVSLDPLAYRRNERLVYDDGTGAAWFNLHLHTWANFVGPFTLEKSSSLAKEVCAAIERNRQSAMFQAAQDYRAHQDMISHVYERAKHAARQACVGIEDAEVRDQTYDAIFYREIEPYTTRSIELGNQATPMFAGMGFTEAAAEFLFKHLRQEAACATA